MASLAVSAFVAASASSLVGTRVTSRNVSTSSVKMTAVRCQAKNDAEIMQRRVVMAAAAASLVATMSGVALAQPVAQTDKSAGEPKNGSPEAKKLYKRVCVTMPTASVCHN
ncbi:hypothetical protein MPTK1_7g16030 [Marchantia polymorpha subsp. ruderalis]|uniref:Photosystem II 5 kDa protein, chloroplastic n=2 Tax=Marchantia polymorpha TaxID=3197 RepID=A0A176VXH0_MARPO|nr:hypothetical protein AXG93_1543s1160 [Marchantia polymorpha subsp. ruderalis]PTQ31456.1 hypothetical protein MARPO_0111s0017 [Marchantia polymorpha]BBN17648.1 hypothetical protein Mp_7g16030 [Marchantia polymorpha subsp. ruderalis]|eukprot:PTQ31456.1 hypothetical protein MARPO_0111s0017 [Marchantia polymorpha]